jgi:DNA-binding HxlR family transcriptional regulator
LEAGLAGVAPSTLSARLKTLEKQGVIGTRLYEKHPPRFEYFLTDKGQTLGPVLKALHKWGESKDRQTGEDRLTSDVMAMVGEAGVSKTKVRRAQVRLAAA